MPVGIARMMQTKTWRAIAGVLLLAFTLQSFITQTHIHGIGTGGSAIVKTLTYGAPHKNAPADNTLADCPFCQAIVHAGAFYQPSAPQLVLPFIWVETVAPAVVAAYSSGFSSHPWQSRAPPQH